MEKQRSGADGSWTGEVAVKDVARTGTECGAEWFVIEQDDHPSGTPMENMQQGLSFLKKCMER